jgi:hypothetical protein
MLFFIYLSDLELFAHLEPQGKIWKLFSRGSHHKPKKNNGNSVFKKKDIGIIFQRFPSQAKNKKNTEIPFSNRIYWHYFPEAPITSKKKGKTRFHIVVIGIIYQKSPKRHGNPVFK